MTSVFTQACAPLGPLPTEADENGVVLPEGFTSRIIARGGEEVASTGLQYRVFPDGAATFADAAVTRGWYLTVNHEIPAVGGVTSIRFAPDGTITDAIAICSDTSLNCAGGATPWGTWLSGEEYDGGNIWECDPTGREPARRRTAMGTFKHEAACVAGDGRIYMTEDRSDGAFYRFTPSAPQDLSSGLLEVATGPDPQGPVGWAPVPEPNPTLFEIPTRDQLEDAIHYEGGEGLATDGGAVYFSTKGDDRIWAYDTVSSSVSLLYQGGGTSTLEGVDNLWFDTASRTLFIAEDGDDMEVVMLGPDNTAVAFARLPNQDQSEITGPCFSPDGQRLYFSSQRGPVGALGAIAGITYEVSGPFDEYLGRR